MLSRRDVLEGNYSYRRDLITLRYSEHAKERLEERSHGIILAPTVLRVGVNNIYSGVSKKGKLVEVTVRLNYKPDKWMFLVIHLESGTVKTIWINDKKKKKATSAREYPVREADCIREEVGIVQESMEPEISRLSAILNTFKRRVEELLLRSSIGKKDIPSSTIQGVEHSSSNRRGAL